MNLSPETLLAAARDCTMTEEEKTAVRRAVLQDARVLQREGKDDEESLIETILSWLSMAQNAFGIRTLSAAMAGIMVITGGGGLAFAAESTLPGDVLYAVKVKMTEPLVGTVLMKTKSKAEWEVRRTERRLEEAQELTAAGRMTVKHARTIALEMEKHAQNAQAISQRVEQHNLDDALTITTDLEQVLSQQGENILQQGNIIAYTILPAVERQKRDVQALIQEGRQSSLIAAASPENDAARSAGRPAHLREEERVQMRMESEEPDEKYGETEDVMENSSSAPSEIALKEETGSSPSTEPIIITFIPPDNSATSDDLPSEESDDFASSSSAPSFPTITFSKPEKHSSSASSSSSTRSTQTMITFLPPGNHTSSAPPPAVRSSDPSSIAVVTEKEAKWAASSSSSANSTTTTITFLSPNERASSSPQPQSSTIRPAPVPDKPQAQPFVPTQDKPQPSFPASSRFSSSSQSSTSSAPAVIALQETAQPALEAPPKIEDTVMTAPSTAVTQEALKPELPALKSTTAALTDVSQDGVIDENEKLMPQEQTIAAPQDSPTAILSADAREEDSSYILIDNSDPRFMQKLAWKLKTDGGYNGSYLRADETEGFAHASWTFSVMPGKKYEVALTWPSDVSGAPDAPFFLLIDGKDEMFFVNQISAPSHFSFLGTQWYRFKTVTPQTNTITIKVINYADGPVFADAVLVREVRE